MFAGANGWMFCHVTAVFKWTLLNFWALFLRVKEKTTLGNIPFFISLQKKFLNQMPEILQCYSFSHLLKMQTFQEMYVKHVAVYCKHEKICVFQVIQQLICLSLAYVHKDSAVLQEKAKRISRFCQDFLLFLLSECKWEWMRGLNNVWEDVIVSVAGLKETGKKCAENVPLDASQRSHSTCPIDTDLQ